MFKTILIVGIFIQANIKSATDCVSECVGGKVEGLCVCEWVCVHMHVVVHML